MFFLLLYCFTTRVRGPFDLYDCTNTAQAAMIDISQTERQRLRDDHLSMFLVFFSLPLATEPNDRGPLYKVVN